MQTQLRTEDAQATMARVAGEVVGRERELELIVAAVAAGRDLLLEGPPGTSKTTLLKAITAAWGVPLVLAEGSAELTPGRLLGHHDPARVLQEGYGEDTFQPGPLVRAMVDGGFLYLEEFNRAPEDTLNALLTAVSDRQVTIPRAGTIVAAPSFRLVGSMNPYDNVGTTRLSVSVRDRFCRLEVGYQDAAAEREVIRRRIQPRKETPLDLVLIEDAVAVTRMTRDHDAVLQGSSVRGAIDLTMMATELLASRAIEDLEDPRYPEAFWDLMAVALSGRLLVDQASGRDATAVLREIWEDRFILAGRLSRPQPGGIQVPDPPPIERPGETGDRAHQATKRRPKQLDDDPSLATGTQGQGLATGAVRDSSRQPRDRRPGSTGFTAESGGLDEEEGEPGGADRAVHAAAHAIASRLALSPPQLRQPRRSGSGDLLSVRYDGSGDEIDLDATLERIVGEPWRQDEDPVRVRERRRQRRALALAVDVSGSMRGERLRTAAATVGALSAELAREELAVIAFWSDAAALMRIGERASAERLVDELLALRAAGLTNVHFPLQLAGEELARARGDSEHRVILLSDCVHNAGPDPRSAVARIPRLDVLFDVSGERDSGIARGLASAGRGLALPIRDHRDVAPALSRMLT